MKPYIILSLMAGMCTASMAGPIDLGSRARLRAAAQDGAAVRTLSQGTSTGGSVRGFVTLAPGHDVSELIDRGLTVRAHRGRLALVETDAATALSLDGAGEVARFSMERTVRPKMDIVRRVTGIDKIHQGQDLPRAYTGKGVVTGIVDGGFDPNHINFRNPDGSSRIGQFTFYRPTQQGGYQEEIHDADYIPNIDTEDETTFHGTHTLGIMAGGWKGQSKVAVKENAFSGVVTDAANPYYGVATDGDIAVAAGALSDYYIALGCETILNYAYKKRAPAVINMSLGSNVGPHDGTSTICQYLDTLAKYDPVVVCISAGNEGDMPIALTKRCTATDNVLASFLYPAVRMTNYQNVRYGQTYVYSDSPTPFEIQAIVVNKTRGVAAMRMPLAATATGAMQYWVSSADYQGDQTDIVSPQFAKWFEGYVGVGAEYDAVSGRYYAVIDCMCWDNTAGSSNNPNGNYIIGFQITGSDGQRIDVYGDGVYNNFSGYGLEGYSDGQFDGTINDVACGKTPVVVGSYNTRDDWASLDRGVYGYRNAFVEGKISPFTSYGTLIDGRTLPTVCAPGATVISSSNEYYLTAAKAGDESRQASVTDGDRVHSWHQCVGTSMASPVVAGSIALWLEADPTLTHDRVRDIIARTAIQDTHTATSGNPVQWGAGKFDAFAGLKEVLRAGVGQVSVDNATRPLVSLQGRTLSVSLPGAPALDVKVFSPAGAVVAAANTRTDEVCLDASPLAPGLYIVNINGTGQKIIIK